MYHIVCGSYESPLYGYLAHLGANKNEKNRPPNKPEHEEPVLGGVVLETIFAYAPHSGAIRSLAAAGEWLVSCSSDESLKVYDMTTRRELGTITRSEGVITCLEFHKSSHLFCGTEKGDVLVWKSHQWEQLPTMKGHSGRINSISVHPSGLLALSTSQDKTLRLWDLVKGVVAHTNKLDYEAEHVKWAPDGEHYIITADKRIVLYSTQGKKLRTMSETKRIISATWINNDHFATGGEDRAVYIWNIHADEPVLTLQGFQNRVKGISIMPKNGKNSDDKYPYIVTISSDERIRVWDPDQSTDTPVSSVYNDVRLICLVVSPVPDTNQKKRKKSSDDIPAGTSQKKKKSKEEVDEVDGDEDDKKKTQNKSSHKSASSSIKKQKPEIVETNATKSDGTPLKSILKKPKSLSTHEDGEKKVKTKFASTDDDEDDMKGKQDRSAKKQIVSPKKSQPASSKYYKKPSLSSLLKNK